MMRSNKVNSFWIEDSIQPSDVLIESIIDLNVNSGLFLLLLFLLLKHINGLIKSGSRLCQFECLFFFVYFFFWFTSAIELESRWHLLTTIMIIFFFFSERLWKIWTNFFFLQLSCERIVFLAVYSVRPFLWSAYECYRP